MVLFLVNTERFDSVVAKTQAFQNLGVQLKHIFVLFNEQSMYKTNDVQPEMSQLYWEILLTLTFGWPG